MNFKKEEVNTVVIASKAWRSTAQPQISRKREKGRSGSAVDCHAPFGLAMTTVCNTLLGYIRPFFSFIQHCQSRMIIILLLSCTPCVYAGLTMEITQGQIKPFPLAIMDFKGDSSFG